MSYICYLTLMSYLHLFCYICSSFYIYYLDHHSKFLKIRHTNEPYYIIIASSNYQIMIACLLEIVSVQIMWP